MLRRFAYPTWTGSKSLSPARRARKQSAELLDFPGVAKEQFAHRETEELLTLLDGVAAKAGRSSVVTGIDIPADDLAGRRLGSDAGKQAWSLAQRYFSGTAPR